MPVSIVYDAHCVVVHMRNLSERSVQVGTAFSRCRIFDSLVKRKEMRHLSFVVIVIGLVFEVEVDLFIYFLYQTIE